MAETFQFWQRIKKYGGKFTSLAENILKGKLRGVHGVCFFAGLPKIVQPLEVGVSGWHRQTDR